MVGKFMEIIKKFEDSSLSQSCGSQTQGEIASDLAEGYGPMNGSLQWEPQIADSAPPSPDLPGFVESTEPEVTGCGCMQPLEIPPTVGEEGKEAGDGGDAGEVVVRDYSQVTNADFLSAPIPCIPQGAFAAVRTKSGNPDEGGWVATSADAVIGIHIVTETASRELGMSAKVDGQASVFAQTGLTAISETELDVLPTDAAGASTPFILDRARRLDPQSFPNPPLKNSNCVPSTIPNVMHLLESYGISARYNAIRKVLTITIPGQSGTPDNANNVAIAQIMSLATLNGMSTGPIPSYVSTIGDRNQYNPIGNWISSKPWDGVDRLPEFYETLQQRDDYPKSMKETLIYRWLLSAVAAALKPSGFRSRGVLTLQGPQSLGKTTWVSALVPDPDLRDITIKIGHHLDAGNKDSILIAIGHWVVEIGELDSSFKKDIALLKGFLTSDRDKVRRPYARSDSEYPRRTVFCASVNDHNFLIDSTGNSRWWTIPVVKVNYAHGIDMQQLFAQLMIDYQKGVQWWLTPEEEALLEELNKYHRVISAVRERVLSAIDMGQSGQPNLKTMTASEVLMEVGLKTPGNMQCKECAAVLREYLGEPKKIRGFIKWRVPLKKNRNSDSATV